MKNTVTREEELIVALGINEIFHDQTPFKDDFERTGSPEKC